tara:strand:- start:309 stop:650 length:342 start_codon:yes stop_codon:yes gene_type:complete
MNNNLIVITNSCSIQIDPRSIKVMLENNKYFDLIPRKGAYDVSIRKRNISTPFEPIAQSQFWSNKPDFKLVQLTSYSWNDHPASMESCRHKTNEIVVPSKIEENLNYIKRWNG